MLLVAEELAVERGGRLLFSELSFAAGRGEAIALRGRNGAGKTSLLRVLAGLLAPLAGTVRLEGVPGGIGGMSHLLGADNAMKPALTVKENLGFWRAFLAATEGAGLQVADALDALGLGNLADLPFGVLSTGQKRRVGFSRLLLRPRPVWLLDEPASGLDAAGERVLAGLVEAHRANGGLAVIALHGAPFTAFDGEIRVEGAA